MGPLSSWRPEALATALAVAVAIVAACTVSSASPPPPPSISPVAPDSACATVRATLPCRVVIVDGRVQRYAVFHNASAAAGPIVLVDLGGPGKNLFGNDDMLAFAAAWGDDATLVFLEEPWAFAPPPMECRDALARTYRGWRSASQNDADLAANCPGRWGWAPADFSHATDAVLKDVRRTRGDARLEGTVGISQGAERTSWLWADLRPTWAVVVSPNPRAGSASEYLQQRTTAVLASWIGQCPGCVDAAAVDEFIAKVRKAWAAAPVVLEDRSVPVNGFDAVAAVVAASYGRSERRSALADALEEHSADAARTIGALSDSLLMRYGVHDMAAGQLAYFQEICSQYPGWGGNAPAAGEVGAFFARVHQPCTQFDAPSPHAAPFPPSATCLGTTLDDGVTGQYATQDWKNLLGPGSLHLEDAGPEHGALEIAARCASALGVGDQ